jgi:hypothetical protein
MLWRRVVVKPQELGVVGQFDYDADKRAGAPIDAALKHMGFSTKHGQALAVLSALKKFDSPFEYPDRENSANQQCAA